MPEPSAFAGRFASVAQEQSKKWATEWGVRTYSNCPEVSGDGSFEAL